MAGRSKGIEPRLAGAGCAPAPGLDWQNDGAAFYPDAALSILPHLDALAAVLPSLTRIAGHYIGPEARPVRAILFDKSPGTNWSLGWHQDRTIVVRERREVPGFGPWGRKAGLIHVEPPFAIIERMTTLRVHIDDVPANNAPLLIAPGSHRLGRIAEPEIPAAVERLGILACLAQRGDVWAYATPILHASAASVGHAQRRVLQVDFAAQMLPGNLEWLGV